MVQNIVSKKILNWILVGSNEHNYIKFELRQLFMRKLFMGTVAHKYI